MAIVFVYNANSGLFNTLGDIAHKVFSPSTYACNLCGVTHTPLGMRKEWKEYLESLHVEKEFLHADELEATYGIKDLALPAILFKEEQGVKPWISAEELNACKDLESMKALVSGKLKERA
ncbi:hypothetical protein JWV37_04325 [Sulfurospirillum sp. T05]|uniref:GTPase n=1 Tax=Sulfurospirillum tamanense TaxID=2813362 RepID=A0ABS2WQU4_9BACT|nr:hypothetical protein [Sulfurospirillum tamanensis]MBN2964000.1 hypothetical protein [Sulfurospirillum tamanensis]